MITVLSIMGCIFAFLVAPFALILGLLGFWAIGFWGALIGVILGLMIQGQSV